MRSVLFFTFTVTAQVLQGPPVLWKPSPREREREDERSQRSTSFVDSQNLRWRSWVAAILFRCFHVAIFVVYPSNFFSSIAKCTCLLRRRICVGLVAGELLNRRIWSQFVTRTLNLYCESSQFFSYFRNLEIPLPEVTKAPCTLYCLRFAVLRSWLFKSYLQIGYIALCDLSPLFCQKSFPARISPLFVFMCDGSRGLDVCLFAISSFCNCCYVVPVPRFSFAQNCVQPP